jgi:hypothetical protein
MTSGYLRGSNNLLAGASAQGGFTIEESLRFNASQSSYLSRTFGTGNRKTYTLSFWIKRGALGRMNFFNPGDNATFGGLSITANNTIEINNRVGGTNAVLETAQLFRDPSAWYHLVWNVDTTQATASNRSKLYVNGTQVTAFSTEQYPAQNADTNINSAVVHWIGRFWESGFEFPFDGYLTEVNFIDGQALTPSSFGQFDGVTGVWKPAKYTGTYGTNGFYLPMQLDNTVEGFNTVTYVGNGVANTKISGVGFSPDLVWIKKRNSAGNHNLLDTVRGPDKIVFSNSLNAESTFSGALASFDTDGFTLASGDTGFNASGDSYVAWCWDAGSSTVSNTDGSITSSVRANPAYGFSVVTYTGNGSNATVGHGLGTAPSMMIVKDRSNVEQWAVYHKNLTSASYVLYLESTGGESIGASWNSTAPTSTIFSIGGGSVTNQTSHTYVAYCFSEVAGYSKFGSYAGTGATSGNVITCGFKPAMVMVKQTNGVGNWLMWDDVRSVSNTKDDYLIPNSSSQELTNSLVAIDFLSNGFELRTADDDINGSGDNYIYMAFADTREYAYWLDDSGNNNDWQPNGGITTESTVTDTPTPYADGGNYATWNPLDKGTVTVTNGNLAAVPASDTHAIRGTIGLPTSDKFYWEITVNGLGYGTALGIASQTSVVTTGPSSAETRTYQFGSWFNTFNSGVVQYGTNQAVTGGASWSGASQLAAGDVLMIAGQRPSGTANPATSPTLDMATPQASCLCTRVTYLTAQLWMGVSISMQLLYRELSFVSDNCSWFSA